LRQTAVRLYFWFDPFALKILFPYFDFDLKNFIEQFYICQKIIANNNIQFQFQNKPFVKSGNSTNEKRFYETAIMNIPLDIRITDFYLLFFIFFKITI
jgi:hypothetical protein